MLVIIIQFVLLKPPLKINFSVKVFPTFSKLSITDLRFELLSPALQQIRE